MADKKNPFSDLDEMDDDEEQDDGGGTMEEDDGEPEEQYDDFVPEEEDDDSYEDYSTNQEDDFRECEEAKTLLARQGIMMPPRTNPRNFMDHLLVALHALSGGPHDAPEEDEPEELEEDPTQPNPQAVEEPQVISMSLKHMDPVQRQLATELADERVGKLVLQVDLLVKEGRMKPATAEKVKNALGAKRMSLVIGKDNPAIVQALATIEAARDLPVGAYWTDQQRAVRMSRASSAGDPNDLYSDDPGEPDDELMDRMTGGQWDGERYRAERAKKRKQS